MHPKSFEMQLKPGHRFPVASTAARTVNAKACRDITNEALHQADIHPPHHSALDSPSRRRRHLRFARPTRDATVTISPASPYDF
jgi:hypothetical protein